MKATERKQIILNTALYLFSQRGYSSVSIRDICGHVGIKESTVYYHFKNKQDIFDELCKSFTDVTYAMPKEFAAEMSKTTTICEKDFILVCQYFLNNYLMDEKINQFIRMLIIEQSTNPQAADIYHKVLFDDALAEQKMIFKWLMDIGFLRNSDLESMVMDYYAPVIYLFHRFLVAEEITEEIKTKANLSLMKHLQHFLNQYKTI